MWSVVARAECLEAEAARAWALFDRLEAALITKGFLRRAGAHDPNDEPASTSLDHILAQRAASEKPERRRPAEAVAAEP